LRSAIRQISNISEDFRDLALINWALISEVVSFLKPFFQASQWFCVERDSNISVVTIIIPGLIEHCQSHESHHIIQIKQASISLKRNLITYVSEIYKPIVNLSTILDPRYKLFDMPQETVSQTIETSRLLHTECGSGTPDAPY